MKPYSVFYSDHYTLELPEEHRFPMSKYKMLRDYLVAENILQAEQIFAAPLASDELLALAHDPNYIADIKKGTIDSKVIKRIGFPWSHSLYLRSCATVGGALASAESALQNKIAGCLAGGTHHAHYDRGEGYCVFNDIAVVAQYLLKNKKAKRIAIIDLDVHQGNGNSSILGQRQDVFVASIHGEKNYPFIKVPSHFDIALPDHVEDAAYLSAVEELLKAVDEFKPDFIFYQMGVDPLIHDKLGKMNISFDGLLKRDQLVLSYTFSNQIPISLALGGGYAEPIEHSVYAYANTYKVVNKIYLDK